MKINPWFFYLAEVSNTARNIATVVGVTGLIMLIYGFLFHEEIMREENVGRIYFSLAYGAIIISGAILLLCPNKQTVYRMMITDSLTSAQGFDYKEVVDYIIGVTKEE